VVFTAVNFEGGIELQTKGVQSKMAGLFLYAAIIQGAIAAVITFLGGFGDQIGLLPVSAARVIASGEAGTWFTVGYLTYLIVGVVAIAVTSLFYFLIETVQGKVYKGVSKALAWVHLVLGNIGVAGAAILAMAGGYLGGAAMQPAKYGGMAWSTGQVHVSILQYYSEPIAAFLLLGIIGFFAGGLGYLIALRSEQ
jgi:heme/copper-type cytochrome/quinol oxidase subunit 1